MFQDLTKAFQQQFLNSFRLFNKLAKTIFNYPSSRQYNKSIPNLKHDLFPKNDAASIIAETEIRNETFAFFQGKPNAKEYYDKLSKNLRAWKSNSFFRLYGGKRDPFYYPVREGFNKLISFDIYCVLIGLIISDAHITPEGVMEIDQTNRKKSNVLFMELLIEILAPIIYSVDIHSTELSNNTLLSAEPRDFDSNLVINPTTGGLIAPALDNYILPNGELDELALGVVLQTLIEKIANQPLLSSEQGKNEPPVGNTSFNTRIRTIPIFKPWHDIFYKRSPDGKNWVKQIPCNFGDVFTNPLMFAISVMADGSSDSSSKPTTSGHMAINDGRLRLNIGGLDGLALKEILEQNFNLIATIDKINTTSPRLLIQMDLKPNGQGKRNMSLCYKLLSPYIIGAMSYKLINPDGPNIKRKPLPISAENEKLLIKQKQNLKNNKFDFNRINNISEFIGHTEDIFIFSYCHNIELQNGDYRMSVKTEIYLRQYIAYIVAIKKYLGSIP